MVIFPLAPDQTIAVLSAMWDLPEVLQSRVEKGNVLLDTLRIILKTIFA